MSANWCQERMEMLVCFVSQTGSKTVQGGASGLAEILSKCSPALIVNDVGQEREKQTDTIVLVLQEEWRSAFNFYHSVEMV